MRFSQVDIYPVTTKEGGKLLAFASIVVEGIVIRQLRIIQGAKGLLVSMPSRKVEDACPACRYFNHLMANYCNECGEKLAEDRVAYKHDVPRLRPDGRRQLYDDVAHPISPEVRRELEEVVLAEYRRMAAGRPV